MVIKISAIWILARRRRVNFVFRISDLSAEASAKADFEFLLKSVHRKHLTLCQIITYEKQAPKFSTIQAIWRTIGAISRVIQE